MSTPNDPRRAEDRLRDAVHTYAETIEPAPDAWARLRGRVEADAPRRPWRTPVAVLAGAAAVAAAVVLVVALTGRGPEHKVNVGPANEGTTSPTAPATTTTAPAEESVLSLYFLRDEKVGVVHRSLAAGATPGAAALTALLEGPTADEKALGFTSTIPEGTTLHGLTIEGGVAEVDLSGSYDDGGGTLSMTARLAEVVFTLTRFPTVESVRFEIDGTPVTAFGGEGILLEDPVDRTDFTDLTPAILVESPAPGDAVTSPLEIRGSSNTFESKVQLRLQDDGGTTLVDSFTTGTGSMGEWAPFAASAEFAPGAATTGTLTVFETSARDGSEINAVEIPVRFASTPGPVGPGTCSAVPMKILVAPPADVPSSTARTWGDVFNAAQACDYDALRALMTPDFSYSFGAEPGADGAIAAWQDLEARGEPVMRNLGQALMGDHEARTEGGTTYYVFGDTRSMGYRAGITGGGDWLYFVAGD